MTTYDSEIAEDLKDLASSDDSEFEPLKEGQKRRSRKQKTKNIPDVIKAFFDEKALGYLLNFPFDYLSRIHKNPSLKLNEDERKTLSELTNKVLSKRMPEFLSKFSDEIALGIALTSVLIPRILLIKETNKKISIQKNTSNGTEATDT